MLDSNTLKTIKRIVDSNLPDKSYKTFIFGSRVTGNNRPFSDIDLGVLGPKPIPNKNYIQLIDDLDSSDIPYRTDVIDFATTSDKFKKKALAKTIEI